MILTEFAEFVEPRKNPKVLPETGYQVTGHTPYLTTDAFQDEEVKRYFRYCLRDGIYSQW